LLQLGNSPFRIHEERRSFAQYAHRCDHSNGLAPLYRITEEEFDRDASIINSYQLGADGQGFDPDLGVALCKADASHDTKVPAHPILGTEREEFAGLRHWLSLFLIDKSANASTTQIGNEPCTVGDLAPGFKETFDVDVSTHDKQLAVDEVTLEAPDRRACRPMASQMQGSVAQQPRIVTGKNGRQNPSD